MSDRSAPIPQAKILICCRGCGAEFSAPAEMAGRETKCRACKAPLTVPGPIQSPHTPIADTQNTRPIARPPILLAAAIVTGAVVLLGSGATAVVMLARPTQAGQAATTAGSVPAVAASTTQRGTVREGPVAIPPVVPQPPTDEADKQKFMELVRANADDPKGLEIISWDERRGNIRAVKFRCAKIGVTPALPGMGAVLPQKGGDPVSVDTAILEYKGDDITQATLNKTYTVWRNWK